MKHLGVVAVFLFFIPAQDRKPNVLLIIADDMGWGDVRSHGNDAIDTPVLDRLASEGARFDRFFVSPLCAPTRAALLTGRYPLRGGVCGVTRGWETMRGDETTIAELLRKGGYATGAFGKWHNGAHHPSHPRGQGFEEFLGFCGGHWNSYFDTTLEHNGKSLPTKGFITDVLTDGAIDFMERRGGGPFFCYVAYNAPHSPFQAPDRVFEKYKAKGLDDTLASVYAMVENVDDNIGRLLKKLDDAALARDTIVVFLTDNGPNTQRFNGGMKGRKGSVDEGGTRVPFFVRHPGRIQAGLTFPQIAAHVDVLPTLLDWCGVPVPTGIDGVSLAPLLKGGKESWPDRRLYSEGSFRGEAKPFPGTVRTQRHRLVLQEKSSALFDMASDPGQGKDIGRENPEIVRELSEAYRAWFADVSRRGVGRPLIPVGHDEMKTVELPAPEAHLHGKAKYHGGSGWANDWISGWNSTEDAVSWELDVVRAAKYEVTLLYCCPEGDAGSKLRIEAGGRGVDAVIERAHDPKPRALPHRDSGKGYVEKEWALLTPGVLDLPAGKTSLYVRALTKPGKSVMELKGVRLRRVD